MSGMPPNVPEEVLTGATFLDCHDPNWRESIDPKTLDISQSSECVFGQRYGDYQKGMRRYNLSPEAAARLGLVLHGGVSKTGYYGPLTAGWKVVHGWPVGAAYQRLSELATAQP